ncbi:nickel pincer cofactor biosynthesis protein LarC [Candidatus Methanomassiliicoccus intestinalis]|jgi:TIGR00299 family protein|uniref:Putative nickel insertion protein n=1 Tax=Candidatus Methanomassiliicoccus intestinalis TaxID=1406512 RepID=A0A8J8TF33_9ARCH|nr:MAG: hypothetical protein A3206_07130 [Candidatus Methanomassiliicoccus intestinalis]TQS84114.1 MAG: hypothetical protein A3207_07315 [Candidatus Methanomassiliicoccus intestinalis]
MDRLLYLECYSGISGDMVVAALLDLGADKEVLMKALHSLSIQGFSVNISTVKKSGLNVCDFNVSLTDNAENHDHDMEYLYGTYEEEPHHSHKHRNLAEILQIIKTAEMTVEAKKIACKTFEILAESEAQAHGLPVEEVHFHEVGAVDSIVDIISAAVCLDNLDLPQVVISDLYEGRGFVRCQHGVIPVPVPAVANIAASNNLSLHIMKAEGEYVTPTGAALAAAFKTRDKLPDDFSIEKVGMGAGKRKTSLPGILRAMIVTAESNDDMICKLECNIDDCSGETLGYTMERLFAAGAKDVHYLPVYMKKNRPAYQLVVICSKSDVSEIEEVIFRETTTIGIRQTEMKMTVMHSQLVQIDTPFGDVNVKMCDYYGMYRRFYPEYSDVVEICRKHNQSYDKTYRMIQKLCEDTFKPFPC